MCASATQCAQRPKNRVSVWRVSEWVRAVIASPACAAVVSSFVPLITVPASSAYAPYIRIATVSQAAGSTSASHAYGLTAPTALQNASQPGTLRARSAMRSFHQDTAARLPTQSPREATTCRP